MRPDKINQTSLQWKQVGANLDKRKSIDNADAPKLPADERTKQSEGKNSKTTTADDLKMVGLHRMLGYIVNLVLFSTIAVLKAERDRAKTQRRLLREDDAEIKHLSKLLGYKKRKSKSIPKIFAAEGLDCNFLFK